MKFRDCAGTSSLFQYQRCYGCCRGCSFVWNGLGSWENVRGHLKWRPYIKIDGKNSFICVLKTLMTVFRKAIPFVKVVLHLH